MGNGVLKFLEKDPHGLLDRLGDAIISQTAADAPSIDFFKKINPKALTKILSLTRNIISSIY